MRNPLERSTSNPVFTRAGLRGAPDASPEQLQQMYDTPAYTGPTTGRMTLDDVVTKTAATLGTVVVAGALTWQFLPVNWGLLIGAMIVGLILGLVISFKHIRHPGAILAYAAVEGVFLGMLSKVLAFAVAGTAEIVPQAIIATLATAGGMLMVYKLKIIRVTPKFTRILVGAVVGFAAVMLVNFIVAMFTGDPGLRGFGGLGLLVSVIGAVLAALVLLLDFEYINQSLAAGVEEKESWFCAFGLTVTLVWLYIEILRILAILASDN